MYDDNKAYAKYLKGKITGHGHGECNDCVESTSSSPCECCPPGLLATRDNQGNFLGCLTPNDSEEYLANVRSCAEGFIALYKEGATPQFRGCVSEDAFEAANTALNPAG